LAQKQWIKSSLQSLLLMKILENKKAFLKNKTADLSLKNLTSFRS
jgi:hypothetical protein